MEGGGASRVRGGMGGGGGGQVPGESEKREGVR